MSRFEITTHTINASHIREFPRATTSGFTAVPILKLAVNQYVPRNYRPSPGDVSVIFCHANGFLKELYEPYFDDLLAQLSSLNVGVRAIWAPDAVHQGASGVLNEGVIGDQPCWNDFARDVLQLVNTFASQLPPPLIGMGHSYGGHAIIRTSLMHPSLFAAMVQIDPVIEEQQAPSGNKLAGLSARRLDVWPARVDAERFFRSRVFYKKWDPRCLEAHLKYGLRDLPTATYPDKRGVTLTTTKHQEVYTFQRWVGPAGQEVLANHLVVGDTFRKLKEVMPPVLYIVGDASPVSSAKANKRKMENTPIAEMIAIKDAGHLIPLEKPTETAIVAAKYVQRQLARWKKDAEEDDKTPRSLQLPESFVREMAKI